MRCFNEDDDDDYDDGVKCFLQMFLQFVLFPFSGSRATSSPHHSRPAFVVGALVFTVPIDYDKESDHSYKAVRTCHQNSDG